MTKQDLGDRENAEEKKGGARGDTIHKMQSRPHEKYIEWQ